eukprot:gene18962-25535_t
MEAASKKLPREAWGIAGGGVLPRDKEEWLMRYGDTAHQDVTKQERWYDPHGNEVDRARVIVIPARMQLDGDKIKLVSIDGYKQSLCGYTEIITLAKGEGRVNTCSRVILGRVTTAGKLIWETEESLSKGERCLLFTWGEVVQALHAGQEVCGKPSEPVGMERPQRGRRELEEDWGSGCWERKARGLLEDKPDGEGDNKTLKEGFTRCVDQMVQVAKLTAQTIVQTCSGGSRQPSLSWENNMLQLKKMAEFYVVEILKHTE